MNKGTRNRRILLTVCDRYSYLKQVHTMVYGQNKKSLHGYGLYQLNVMFFWTLVMPVVKYIAQNIFLQKLPDFSVTNRFLSVFYSVKMPKLDGGKIRQFLKKNILCNIFYYWHHKSPEKCHIELVESIMAERFLFFQQIIVIWIIFGLISS